jgi:hypothetical protein
MSHAPIRQDLYAGLVRLPAFLALASKWRVCLLE